MGRNVPPRSTALAAKRRITAQHQGLRPFGKDQVMKKPAGAYVSARSDLHNAALARARLTAALREQRLKRDAETMPLAPKRKPSKRSNGV